jgi:hypothetical protein
LVHVLGFQALVEALQRQRARDRREEEEREREREREGRRGAEKGSARRRRTIKKRRSVVGEGEWRWGSRMRKPSECGSF